jgi:hypothetical protein
MVWDFKQEGVSACIDVYQEAEDELGSENDNCLLVFHHIAFLILALFELYYFLFL